MQLKIHDVVHGTIAVLAILVIIAAAIIGFGHKASALVPLATTKWVVTAQGRTWELLERPSVVNNRVYFEYLGREVIVGGTFIVEEVEVGR